VALVVLCAAQAGAVIAKRDDGSTTEATSGADAPVAGLPTSTLLLPPPISAPPPTAAPGGTTPQTSPTTPPTAPSGTTPATQPPVLQFRPLGTASSAIVADPSCHSQECRGFEVRCPGVQPLRGVLGIDRARGQARGLVLLLAGGSGSLWWDSDGEGGREAVTELRDGGLDVVQLRWVDSWLQAPEGQAISAPVMACRPATAIPWVYQQLAAGRPFETNPGACGFCVSGHSGGATALAYAISWYGVYDMIRAAVFTSGPPHAAITEGCLRHQGDEDYWYTQANAQTIDGSYGYLSQGPCVRHDGSMSSTWDHDSVDGDGTLYDFPTVRIAMILGGQDVAVPAHAKAYLARLQQAGSPSASSQTVPTMGHTVVGSKDGRDALVRTLLAN
jgi:hypothetical protein